MEVNFATLEVRILNYADEVQVEEQKKILQSLYQTKQNVDEGRTNSSAIACESNYEHLVLLLFLDFSFFNPYYKVLHPSSFFFY